MAGDYPGGVIGFRLMAGREFSPYDGASPIPPVTPLHKFLVVDDVPENRFLVSKSLLKKFPGSLVQECEESTPAIAAVQHDRLSAIIVHRGLDVDGPTMVALLRRVNPSVPIIMVSGRESCPAAIEAGANAFLNYESWQRIGALVEQTIAEERVKARESQFPFVAAPRKNPDAVPVPKASSAGPAGSGVAGATLPGSESSSVPRDESGVAPRILYLEDDAGDVTLLRAALAAEGVAAEIVHVNTPQDYSAELKRPAPKLILADGRVAGFPTMAALDLARAWCPQAPFYCLTGHINGEKVETLRNAGAAGCLSKQDLTAVSKIVRTTLENRR